MNIAVRIAVFFMLGFLFSCGGGAIKPKEIEGGNKIPVLMTEKARKAKVSFALTEVVQKDDKLDVVIMVSNRGKEGKIIFEKQEFSLTDNNGVIIKPTAAAINDIPQFGIVPALAHLKTDDKVRSVISFEGLTEDALTGTLFFKGMINRGKVSDFNIKFKNIKIKE